MTGIIGPAVHRRPDMLADRVHRGLVHPYLVRLPVVQDHTIGWQIKHDPGRFQLVVACEPDDAQRPVWRAGTDRVGPQLQAGESTVQKLSGKSADVRGRADKGGIGATGVWTEVQPAGFRRKERSVDIGQGGARTGPQSQSAQKIDAGPDGASRGHGGHAVRCILADGDRNQRRPRIMLVALGSLDFRSYRAARGRVDDQTVLAQVGPAEEVRKDNIGGRRGDSVPGGSGQAGRPVPRPSACRCPRLHRAVATGCPG